MGNAYCRSCPHRTLDSVDGGEDFALSADVPLNIPAVAQEKAGDAANKEAQARARRGVKATAAALRIRTLAENTEAVWAKMQSEFEVQKMVWESLGLARGARHQGLVAALQSKIEFAVVMRKVDRASTIVALQTAVEKSASESGLLNMSMETGLQAVISAELLSEVRLELAVLLEDLTQTLLTVTEAKLRATVQASDLEPKLRTSVFSALAFV